jgi:hypothetical protein
MELLQGLIIHLVIALVGQETAETARSTFSLESVSFSLTRWAEGTGVRVTKNCRGTPDGLRRHINDVAIDFQQDSLKRLLFLQLDSQALLDLGAGSLPFPWDLSEKLFRILFRIQQGQKFSLFDRGSRCLKLVPLGQMVVDLRFR